MAVTRQREASRNLAKTHIRNNDLTDVILNRRACRHMDLNFLRASYDNLKDLCSHLVALLIAMNSASAYDAVAYVLKYCAHNGIGHLTHRQTATITGHSCTTVTSIMHEIALGKPELLC